MLKGWFAETRRKLTKLTCLKKANVALYLIIKNIIYIFATEYQTEQFKFHLNGKITSGIRMPTVQT